MQDGQKVIRFHHQETVTWSKLEEVEYFQVIFIIDLTVTVVITLMYSTELLKCNSVLSLYNFKNVFVISQLFLDTIIDILQNVIIVTLSE